jgi:competence protein ComEC
MIELLKKISVTKSKVFVYLMLAFIIGIWLSEIIIDVPINIFIMYFFGVAILSIFFYDIKIVVLTNFCVLLLFSGIIYSNHYKKIIEPKYNLSGNEQAFIGLIDNEPDVRSNNVKLQIKVTSSDDANLIGQKVLLTTTKYPTYSYGDVLKISGVIKKPEKFDNFDYGKYLSRYQIFSIITSNDVELVSHNNGNRFFAKILLVKKYFQSSVRKIFPEPESSLAEGIIIGSKGEFSSELKDQMISSGTTHIVVVSGQNTEVAINAFSSLTQFWPQYISFGVGILSLIIYVLITGSTASVVRAAILASLFLFSRVVGRKKQITNLLIFVALIMLLQNPMILRFDIGFQLSFMAMIGLIFITPLIQSIFKKIPESLNIIISSTLAAQIATMPIILFNFGRLSIVAPITNSLILFVIPLAMAMVFASGILGILVAPLGLLLGAPTYIILTYVIKVIQFSSKIPYASININFNNVYWVLIYYLIVVLVIYNYKKALPKGAYDLADR